VDLRVQVRKEVNGRGNEITGEPAEIRVKFIDSSKSRRAEISGSRRIREILRVNMWEGNSRQCLIKNILEV